MWEVISFRIYFSDIPLVSLPTEIKEVTKGSDTLLDCSYDSYPDPTNVFWKKDDNIIKSSNTFRRTYNGSSVEMSVLVLHDTKQSDAGNYVCVVENSIGTGYSKILELIITGKNLFVWNESKSNPPIQIYYLLTNLKYLIALFYL